MPMKILLTFFILAFVKSQNNVGFYNISRPYFKFIDLQLQKSSEENSCSFCPNDIWKDICTITIGDSDDDQKEFTIAVRRKLKMKNIYSCETCLNKINVFKDIESQLSKCSLKKIGIENLNYGERKQNDQNCYLVLEHNNKQYAVVKNNNTVQNIENILFLFPVSELAPKKFKIESNGELINFLDLTYDGQEKCSFIPKAQFDTESMKKFRSIDPTVLLELQKGRPWLTLKNVAVFICVYYSVGIFLVLVYYNFNKEKANLEH